MYNDIRPMVLTIAGFDPSAGAGLLADIKVFEHCQVYGQAVCTALTVQNEHSFLDAGWMPWTHIEAQLHALSEARSYGFVKIGLVESAAILQKILEWLRARLPDAFIIWDPIIKASAGFAFHESSDRESFLRLLSLVDLITPNLPEAQYLSGLEGNEALVHLAGYTAVLLKGGHGSGEDSQDLLMQGNKLSEFSSSRVLGVERHGSGCTLSSAILANLALGHDLPSSCQRAKELMDSFFRSGTGKLGYL